MEGWVGGRQEIRQHTQPTRTRHTHTHLCPQSELFQPHSGNPLQFERGPLRGPAVGEDEAATPSREGRAPSSSFTTVEERSPLGFGVEVPFIVFGVVVQVHDPSSITVAPGSPFRGKFPRLFLLLQSLRKTESRMSDIVHLDDLNEHACFLGVVLVLGGEIRIRGAEEHPSLLLVRVRIGIGVIRLKEGSVCGRWEDGSRQVGREQLDFDGLDQSRHARFRDGVILLCRTDVVSTSCIRIGGARSRGGSRRRLGASRG